MILFWNKREVYAGLSFEKFSKIREALIASKIEYGYKIENQSSSHAFGSRQSSMGTLSENQNYSKMHTLFVHKRDYDEALAVIYKIK